jgi:sigma-B regulation protein RsbU (phosphoserine phosphatase)
LSKGSRLIFYSDGITEAVDSQEEEYGLCRLVADAVQPDASALTILDDVRSFASGSGVHDDATVVFVGVNP